MNIRRLQHNEIEKVVSIFDDYRVHFGQQSDIKMTYEFLYRNVSREDAVIFIAEANEQVIGFVQLYKMLSSMNMANLLIINDLFLTAAARGQHIGEQLMDQAFTYGKENGYETIYLETEKSNVAGNRLYQKLGMKIDEEHHYYHKQL